MDCHGRLGALCRLTGIAKIAWQNLRAGLFIFNYHRIGRADCTVFDPHIFSCSEERFAEHVELIRSRFEVIGVDHLLAMIDRREPLTEPVAMITFDDAYRDNYTKAFPILQKMHTPGVFFVPTNYIGAERVGWWDEVAWMVGGGRREDLAKVPWLGGVELPLPRAHLIRGVLRAAKSSSLPIEVKLSQLREATGRVLDVNETERLFMDWEEIRVLKRAGMDIGSHTCSHPVLAQLDPADQRTELEESKRVLEAETGAPVLTIAYPVGTPSTYTTATQQIAKACGYRAGFGFISGLNERPWMNRYDLCRMTIDRDATVATLQLTTAVVSLELNRYPGMALARRSLRCFSSLMRHASRWNRSSE